MITPILKDPKKHGGTLYTFPSASRDLTRAFSNSEYEFAFSHFACLNLPDFRYGNFEDNDLKGIYLDNLAKYYYSTTDSGLLADSDSDSISDLAKNQLNTCLKWHLQSYVMNFEVAILNGNYNMDILQNPSERIFFNWLQKVGAIKFSGNGETLKGYGDDANIGYEILGDESKLLSANKDKTYRIDNKLYVYKGGEWRSRILVSKTVQYIGSIDMVNNVNIDCDSFNEIYLNIPAGVGGSTNVIFNNIFDNYNYREGAIINVRDDIYCDKTDTNREYIIGRNPVDLNMVDDVTLKAIYDSEYDHSYGFASPTYKIENGYCIDFNESRYGDGLSGSIERMNLNSEEDFEFNCVLIYYRIRKDNGKWYTNLYGVLFLEEVATSDYNVNLNEDDERAGYIQRYPKFKKGNSWGLKLDLKIDAQPDSQMELREKEYDDPNGADGMQMFTEALMHLNDCTKLFYEVKKENTDIEERLYTLENIVSGVDTMYELRDNVGILRNKIEMIQPAINSLEGRMEDVESRLSKIENNLGYLISDIKNLESGISNFENQISSKFEAFSNAVIDLIGNKVEVSLRLGDSADEQSLNKIIII